MGSRYGFVSYPSAMCAPTRTHPPNYPRAHPQVPAGCAHPGLALPAAVPQPGLPGARKRPKITSDTPPPSRNIPSSRAPFQSLVLFSSSASPQTFALSAASRLVSSAAAAPSRELGWLAAAAAGSPDDEAAAAVVSADADASAAADWEALGRPLVRVMEALANKAATDGGRRADKKKEKARRRREFCQPMRRCSAC